MKRVITYGTYDLLHQGHRPVLPSQAQGVRSQRDQPYHEGPMPQVQAKGLLTLPIHPNWRHSSVSDKPYRSECVYRVLTLKKTN